MRATFATFVILFVATSTAKYDVRYEGGLTITTYDQSTVLVADAYIPITTNASQLFPALIFPNSWASPQFEYLLKTLGFAEKGYVALEYETRGWYRSGGHINMAGPDDVRDASAVVDYVTSLSTQWQVDLARVAFVGISYGAGIALEAAGRDRRVATAVSMSGWGNMTDCIHINGSPNTVWLTLMDGLADLLGNPSAEMSTLLTDLIQHKNMTFVNQYANERSPLRYLDEFNSRQVPIFLSSNFLDRLFLPEYTTKFFEMLTGPKFMLLNQGMHAEAELPGLIDGNNYIWLKAQAWLDYIFLGTENGIMQEPPVQLQLQNGSWDTYIKYPSWPNPPALTPKTLYFTHRGNAIYGGLSSTPEDTNGIPPDDVIAFTDAPPLSDGIPIFSDLLSQVVKIPVEVELITVPRANSVVYMSQPMATTTRLCGTPHANVSFFSAGRRWQIYGYLYDVDELDFGKLVTDMEYTHFDTPTADRTQVFISADFHSICQDVVQGHRIAVGFVLYSNLYTPSTTSAAFNITMLYGAHTGISLPINPML